jgi:hypothetical protein
VASQPSGREIHVIADNLATHKNEALTAAEMGNSPAVIFHHYRALVTPEAAEKYWKLMPETESDAQNMVEFAA